MGWNILNRKAPLEIEVDGVAITLKPLSWAERGSLAQKFSKVSLGKETDDIDDAIKSICQIIGAVIITVDGKEMDEGEATELLHSIDDMAQFGRVRDAIFGAYRFNENAEKN